MKKFKYQKYDYNNILKNYSIKSAKEEDGVIYMNIDFSSNELTIQFNINDLTADET